jgi:hypothetical protein
MTSHAMRRTNVQPHHLNVGSKLQYKPTARRKLENTAHVCITAAAKQMPGIKLLLFMLALATLAARRLFGSHSKASPLTLLCCWCPCCSCLFLLPRLLRLLLLLLLPYPLQHQVASVRCSALQ